MLLLKLCSSIWRGISHRFMWAKLEMWKCLKVTNLTVLIDMLHEPTRYLPTGWSACYPVCVIIHTKGNFPSFFTLLFSSEALCCVPHFLPWLIFCCLSSAVCPRPASARSSNTSGETGEFECFRKKFLQNVYFVQPSVINGHEQKRVDGNRRKHGLRKFLQRVGSGRRTYEQQVCCGLRYWANGVE